MNTATPPNTVVYFRRASDFQPSAKDTRRLSKMTQRETLKQDPDEWTRLTKVVFTIGIIVWGYIAFQLGRALGAW